MAGGKETPRQKMIGLMYLVLMAMLAMNVSKEVLDSFILIDGALENGKNNTKGQNDLVYAKFAQQMQMDEAKTKKWNDKAQEVKKLASEMAQYVEDTKRNVIYFTEGMNKEFPETFKDVPEEADSLFLIQNFPSKDNYDWPTNVMIGSDVANLKDGEYTALDLHNRLQAYVDQLKAIIGTKGQQEVSIPMSFDDVKQPDGTFESWEAGNFYHIPIAAVVTTLTRMEADVRNAEADVLSYLLAQIDGATFKFDSIAAIPIPNTDYVIQGDSFTSEIIAAAFSTTSNPQIELGTDIDTAGKAMADWKVINPITSGLSIENGAGRYAVKASSTGEKTWAGFVKVLKPGTTDEYLSYPFKHSYIVAKPALVVSPTKMNVFYRDVENPVSVSVSGIAESRLKVSCSNGSIIKKDGGYIVKPGSGNTAKIKVSATMEDGTTKSFGEMEFRVKSVPPPKAMFAGIKGSGESTKAQVANTDRVFAIMENFDFELKFDVVGFDVIGVVGGKIAKASSSNNKISGQQKNILKKLTSGSMVTIDNIRVRGPGGLKKLDPIVITIN